VFKMNGGYSLGSKSVRLGHCCDSSSSAIDQTRAVTRQVLREATFPATARVRQQRQQGQHPWRRVAKAIRRPSGATSCHTLVTPGERATSVSSLQAEAKPGYQGGQRLRYLPL
jgi:hypothetical protein